MNFEKIKNPLDETVRNVFGGWDNLKSRVKETMRDAGGNEDFKPGSIEFVRAVLGSYADKLKSDEFNYCIQAINIIVGRIKKEKKKTAQEKYVQREMPFGGE